MNERKRINVVISKSEGSSHLPIKTKPFQHQCLAYGTQRTRGVKNDKKEDEYNKTYLNDQKKRTGSKRFQPFDSCVCAHSQPDMHDGGIESQCFRNSRIACHHNGTILLLDQADVPYQSMTFVYRTISLARHQFPFAFGVPSQRIQHTNNNKISK